MSQFVDENLWKITQTFYGAYSIYYAEKENYENKVKQYLREKKVARDRLAEALNWEEKRCLLSYEQFNKLSENYLDPLKKRSRRLAKITDKQLIFEHYVRRIYYEVSLLKIECHKLTIDEDFSDEEEDKLYAKKNIAFFFAVKIVRLSELFEKAKSELEILLQRNRESKIFLRSLFLFGEEIVAPAYSGGLFEFLKNVYSETKGKEFYIRSAHSFYSSGFSLYAEQCMKIACRYSQKSDSFSIELQSMLKKLTEAIPSAK